MAFSETLFNVSSLYAVSAVGYLLFYAAKKILVDVAKIKICVNGLIYLSVLEQ